jgi:hypothetical protein
MRLMSFSMTEEALLAGRKTVTRRLGWATLQPGTHLCAVRKAMGLRPGEKVVRLGTVTVEDVRRERLDDITHDDVLREGFVGMSSEEFVDLFTKAMRCARGALVTRIEFTFVPARSEVA